MKDIDIYIERCKDKDMEEVRKLKVKVYPRLDLRRAANKLRQEGSSKLDCYSLVARDGGGNLIGSIETFLVRVGGYGEVVMIGPVIVEIESRGSGIAKGMVSSVLTKIEEDGSYGGAILIGDAGYYVQFGFRGDVVKDMHIKGEILPYTLLGIEFMTGYFRLLRESGVG